MTQHFRLAVCGTALIAGLWCFVGASAAPTPLHKETYKKLIESDIATVKAQLKWIAENPKDVNAKAAARTVKTLSMLLVFNAESTGDAALREQALKVAETSKPLIDAVKPRPTMRDEKAVLNTVKAVAAEAEKLTFKPGAAPLKHTEVFKDAKYDFDLEQAMTPFRPGDRGGTNIEKDIRDMIAKDKPPLKVDPANVELLAARTVLIGEFALAYPNDKAKMAGNLKEWNQLTKDMVEIGQKLAEEARKGKSADEKAILKMLDALNGKCYTCHSHFRDE